MKDTSLEDSEQVRVSDGEFLQPGLQAYPSLPPGVRAWFYPLSPRERGTFLAWDVEIPEALGPSIPALGAAMARQCGSEA